MPFEIIPAFKKRTRLQIVGMCSVGCTQVFVFSYMSGGLN